MFIGVNLESDVVANVAYKHISGGLMQEKLIGIGRNCIAVRQYNGILLEKRLIRTNLI
jgi:hypothetical protein